MNIINTFLRAKHWQLFLVIIGVPILLNIILGISMFADVVFENNPDALFLYDIVAFFPLIMIVMMGGLFGWFWSIVNGLQDKIPHSHRMNLTRFKFLFFIPIIYILGLSLFISGTISGVIDGKIEEHAFTVPITFAVIMPLHFLSMASIFHSMYYVAKTIKMAELQKEVKFIDALGEFVLTWFYPIGIWFLQPKINKMIKEDNQETSSFIERH